MKPPVKGHQRPALMITNGWLNRGGGEMMSEMPLETLIEATLFSSGKSMSVQELSEALGYDADEMLDALGSLQATLRRRKGGALQLAEVGDRWALEVKPVIATHLPKATKTDMPPKLLKAAALI